MKLPAWILEKWTEEASPPATLNKRLRILPYGACLSPKLLSWEEAAKWSFWDYQSSHRGLLHKSMARLLSQQWTAPTCPALGRHTWTHCVNRSSVQETPFQSSHHHFHLFYETFSSQGGGSIQTRWQSDVPGLQTPEVNQREKGKGMQMNTQAPEWHTKWPVRTENPVPIH